jgi:LuxR family maltose regulon positive regulatory protein
LALAQAQFERDRLPEALAAVGQSIELAHQAGWAHVLWQAYALQAGILARQGHWAGAREAQARAEQIAERYPLAHVRRRLAANQARLALETGDVQAARQWAEAYAAGKPALPGLQDFEALTQARVWLAAERAREALVVLEGLLQTSALAGRGITVIQAHVLRAQGLAALGQPDASFQALGLALELAGPEDIAGPFADDGVVLAAWLEQAGRRPAPANALRYARALKARPGSNGQPRPAAAAPGVRQVPTQERGGLVEPLSPRELEVLRLLAEGLSNAEIAARLFLSVNTLRAHTSNIYQKLDVHSRIQAVHRAKGLGLLGEA